MKCVSCGGVLEINSDLESARCKACGLEYSKEVLATLKEKRGISNDNNEESGAAINAPIGEPVLIEPTTKVDKEAQFSAQTQNIQDNRPRSVSVKDESDAPALKNWKTSIGCSILGIFVATALNSLVSIDSNWVFVNVIYLISAIVYAVRFYPKLYSEKPFGTSSKTISFWNWFFGGYIFGAIWNHNLTRKKKGVSNIVFTVYIIAICAIAIGLILTVMSINPLTQINGGKLDESQNRWTYTYTTALSATNGLYKQNTITARNECISALTEMGLSESNATRIWVELESSSPTSTRDYDDVVNYLLMGLNTNSNNPPLMQVPVARRKNVLVTKHEEIRKTYFTVLNKEYILMLMTVSDNKFGDEGYTILIEFLY